MTKAYHLANSAEWATPLEVVNAATTVLGSIDLDPASTFELNRDRVHATSFFDADTDGLSQNWQSRVFVNPPGGCRVERAMVWREDADCAWMFHNSQRGGETKYGWKRSVCGRVAADPKTPGCGCGLVSKFWNKLIQQHLAGIVCSAIWIGFSVEQLQTSQNFNALDELTPHDFALCFPRRRLPYSKADDLDASSSPPHASYVCYLGPRRSHFRSVFLEFGKVIG